jgi:hypothetical protein
MPGAARAVLLFWKAWVHSSGFIVESDGVQLVIGHGRMAGNIAR